MKGSNVDYWEQLKRLPVGIVGEKVRSRIDSKWRLLSIWKRILNKLGENCTLVEHSRACKSWGPELENWILNILNDIHDLQQICKMGTQASICFNFSTSIVQLQISTSTAISSFLTFKTLHSNRNMLASDRLSDDLSVHIYLKYIQRFLETAFPPVVAFSPFTVQVVQWQIQNVFSLYICPSSIQLKSQFAL